jgi:hypothetical protein
VRVPVDPECATSRDARVDLFREKEKKKDHHRSMATQQPNVGFPTLQNPTVARPTDCPQEMASLKKVIVPTRVRW